MITEEEKLPEEIKEDIEPLYKAFNLAKRIYMYYMDIPEDEADLHALYDIASYFHNNFETFPFLFINAMRGSGKTRCLRIHKALSWGGELLASLTDAVMFRGMGTLIVDEFENIANKERNSLRELFNTAYKKGTKVHRLKKKKTKEGDEQVLEEYEPFRPIIMANIWGLEEVLQDRCITLVLEKSNKPIYTKLVENFEDDVFVKEFKTYMFEVLSDKNECSYVVKFGIKHLYMGWNMYIKSKYTTQITLHTSTTPLIYTQDYTNNYTISQQEKHLQLFNKIDSVDMSGRNFELFFPLFLVAYDIDSKLLDRVLIFAKKIIEKKATEEKTESKDVLVYDFVANKCDDGWNRVKELTNAFRLWINEEEDEIRWLNEKWFGRALKRLNLVKEKDRRNEGIIVILNIEKAKEKLKIFR